MKRTIKYFIITLVTILSCTKHVDTIISIDYKINEDFVNEGFINSSLPTTINIVPIQILDGFDYFVKYEIESGKGFYSSGSNIISNNEFVPLTNLNFIADYVPLSPGEHKIKFTIKDEANLSKSINLIYSISNLNLEWTATTELSEAIIGQEIPITLTFANKTSNSSSIFYHTIQITNGAGNLSNDLGGVELNKKTSIIPNIHNFTAVATKIGTFTVNFEVEDENGQKLISEILLQINEKDEDSPVITLNGDNPLIINENDTYIELGAIAKDKADGDLTKNISIDNTNVDTSKPGSYNVSYNVEDLSGNIAKTVIREVIVLDVKAPVITLLGENPQIIEVGNPYNELGAVTDDGSSIAPNASQVDINRIGSYEVTYDASDGFNDAVQVIRTVNVVDTTKPVITLTGENPQTIELGNPYQELGAITDDGSPVVYDASNIDINSLGSYEVTYNSSDGINNADQVIRRVNVVVPNLPPVAVASSVKTISTGNSVSVFVQFTGSNSTDDHNDIVRYQWLFGTGEGGSAKVNPSHTYTKAGLYFVSLTVTDGGGKQDQTNFSILILNPL